MKALARATINTMASLGIILLANDCGLYDLIATASPWIGIPFCIVLGIWIAQTVECIATYAWRK